MKAFVTGITGFAGSFLAEELLKEGIRVSGTYLSDQSLANVSKIQNKLELFKLDLLDNLGVEKVVKQSSPDLIFHLAALASAKDSFANPQKFLNNNASGQINLLEAVKKSKIDPKILIISSAEVYGLVNKDNLPINEDTPLNPTNPYAVSKLCQDYLGLMYYHADKQKIVRVRPFNHTGPRQTDSFVIPSFAKKIVEIEKKKKEPTIRVGNLKSKRDFTDVRDMVKAYILALKLGKLGDVYNLGSGKSYYISEILDKMLKLSTAQIKVEEERSLFRPIDNPDLVCDFTKFAKLTNWKPKVDIDETLRDTLDYWRNII